MSALVSSLPEGGAVSALPASAASATPPAGEAVANGSAIALYARPSAGYAAKLERTLALLRAAAAEHAGRIVQATSLGVEDMVITDLIACHALPIAIATLETGKLHRETAALIGRIEQRYGLAVAVYRPREEQVVHFVRENGEEAMYRSLALRKACCGLRKLEPLSRMLADRTAWVTGLRREQSDARGEVPFRDRDDAGRLKLNALADWTWGDVWHHVDIHEVPYNPLHDHFMPSIGCAPCTRAIAVGEPFRAGRWWWEDEAAKECGLHVHQEAGATAR
jgi:phosphoadenosine phosphosulfate reductase